MPVVLDPDSKAVYKAFLDAKRPPYENGRRRRRARCISPRASPAIPSRPS